LFATVDRDDADHGSPERHDESARAATWKHRHRRIELVARARSAQERVHIGRTEKVEEGRAILLFRGPEYKSIGPDGYRRPVDAGEVAQRRASRCTTTLS